MDYIKNIYRVLLSRGRKGCCIYCCDSKLRDYFAEMLERAKKTDENDAM